MGGGGSPDYTAQAAKDEAKKQAARDALNAAFGIAPANAPAATAITPGANAAPHGAILDRINGPKVAADQAAADLFAKETSDAAANKTARDAMYDKVRSDAYGAGKTSLDETRDSAARNNKFALFAQGLNGGSQDVDESALLGRTYSKGLLDLGAKADLARSSLQSSDEAARLGLLQSIDNGMDQGSAMTSALQQMKNGADTAEATAQGTDLGDLFAASGALYTKSAAARGAQNAYNYFGANYGPSSPLYSGKSSGIVSATYG